MTETYRGMDRAALDDAYSNSKTVPDVEQIRERWIAGSAATRGRLPGGRDLAYGPTPRETLDLFTHPGSGAPVLVFIHGGYWQSQVKETFSVIADGPVRAGFQVVLLEYTLAPEARMARIVDEVRRGVAWVAAHAAEFGGDPARIVVSGHSAGGHLTALCLDLPGVIGGLAISGLFDLEPIRLSGLNDKLQLDAAAAAAFSPMRHPGPAGVPLAIGVGSAERPELVRQSADFAALRQAAGLPTPVVGLPGHNHFSILDEFADTGILTQAALRLAARIR